ncbi:hypothetical protein [Amycolatopsis sp. NPDC051128]|uniref:hypothetical protein n=1 Tax=Amycolatopsis sp. NPDC051128 TaxID=3155412 RepID=UPI0034392066
MNSPISRRTAAPTWSAEQHRVSARLVRATHNEIDQTQAAALVQSTRTQAVGYVAASALRAVEDLTNMEELALQRSPLGEARYRAIVDTAAGVMAHIVAETGR